MLVTNFYDDKMDVMEDFKKVMIMLPLKISRKLLKNLKNSLPL